MANSNSKIANSIQLNTQNVPDIIEEDPVNKNYIE